MNARYFLLPAVLSLVAPLARADTPPPAAEPAAPAAMLLPPPQPRHEQRMLDNAADLARDLADIVSFLEQGQSYFRAFKKSSHTKEENAAMLKFLEAYEKEREIAKKESGVLDSWVKTRSDLEPPAQTPPAGQ